MSDWILFGGYIVTGLAVIGYFVWLGKTAELMDEGESTCGK